jgi:hypothetical protein
LKDRITPHRPARLLADENRLQRWFESLDEFDRQRSYTLEEIRAAIGVPLTRLRVAMYRLGWHRERDRAFRLDVYRGPTQQPAQSPTDEIDEIIRKLSQL